MAGAALAGAGPLAWAGGAAGLLALGSEDLQRFYPEMGTLYLARIGEGLDRRGFAGELFVMQSGGGVLAADVAREFPAVGPRRQGPRARGPRLRTRSSRSSRPLWKLAGRLQTL